MSADQAPAAPTYRLSRTLTACGGLVLTLAGIRAANGILGPVLLGVVIVVTVYPLARWLRTRGAPGWLTMVVTMLVAYGVILTLVLGTLLALAAFVRTLPEYAGEFVDLQERLLAWLAGLGISTGDLQDAISGLSAGQVASGVRSAVGSIGTVLTMLLLMLTVTFFIVLDSSGFPQRMAAIRQGRPDVAAGLTEFARGTRTYLLVTTVFGGIVALADVVVLTVMGIPNPWVWGLLAFLTGYIPNVGFVIGLIPVAILALLQDGWTAMVIVVVAYSLVNFLLQSLVQPKFVGDSVGLATTVTFLSLAFWTFILGPLGAILAVPMTLLARGLLITSDPAMHWAQALVSSTPTEKELGRLEALEEFAEMPDPQPASDIDPA